MEAGALPSRFVGRRCLALHYLIAALAFAANGGHVVEFHDDAFSFLASPWTHQ
jgi:hypothetical protein